ncbi:MAG TPA: YihA family ribosome biogenesis GTP-binding protein [Erysipelotrichaceae bacterium]|nr:YihA family ribosome biogenesis GTP-binding protein [Erysipelotrichaceae bacterium]
MIDFNNATFIKSCPNRESKPQEIKPEVLIVGRSNVGKSSLINALTNKKKLAFTSKKPGHTRLLNYYDIDNRFYLVDAPGYGYARGGINLDKLFSKMMTSYFLNNNELKLVLVLLDARRTINEDDQQIIDYLRQYNLPYYLVITKIDKVNQKEKAALEKHLREKQLVLDDIYYASIQSSSSLNLLRKGIEKRL